MEIPDDRVIQPNIRRPHTLEIHFPRPLEISQNISYMPRTPEEAAFLKSITDRLIRKDQLACADKDPATGRCHAPDCTTCNIFDKSILIDTHSLKVLLKRPEDWPQSVAIIRTVLSSY